MAKGVKSGGRSFKKGKSGNPKGRPTVPQDIKEARTINKHEVTRILTRFMYLKREDLKKIVKSQNSTAIELLTATVVMKAIQEGDERRFDFLLNRLIGAVPRTDKVDLTGNMPILHFYMPDNGRRRKDP